MTLVDLAGHERYFKTTAYGLTGHLPGARYCAAACMLSWRLGCHAAMPCHAMPCHAMCCHAATNAVPCHAMPYCATSCHAWLCYAMPMPCCAMPCHVLPCRTRRAAMPHHASSCRAMPCHGVASCFCHRESTWQGVPLSLSSPCPPCRADYACLIVGANAGVVGMCKEHLGVALALKVS